MKKKNQIEKMKVTGGKCLEHYTPTQGLYNYMLIFEKRITELNWNKAFIRQ